MTSGKFLMPIMTYVLECVRVRARVLACDNQMYPLGLDSRIRRVRTRNVNASRSYRTPIGALESDIACIHTCISQRVGSFAKVVLYYRKRMHSLAYAHAHCRRRRRRFHCPDSFLSLEGHYSNEVYADG